MKKSKNINPQAIHQEILIIAQTSLAGKQFCNKESDNNKKGNSPLEELEKACWAGLLFEILPELVGNAYARHETFIWEITAAKNFIRICMGAAPGRVESRTSLDPYFFLETILFN